MERLAMRLIQDIIYRLRLGQSERLIARDLGLSRDAVHRYHRLAQDHDFLDPDQPLPDADLLQAQLGDPPTPPRPPSTVEPFHDVVKEWLDQGVERVAIYQRLIERYGYTGSYSSVLRFTKRLLPAPSRAVVRIETPPGRQAQVDFGAVGKLPQPDTGKLRLVYAFVMTLSFSRHQYLEFVFDQTIPTWIRCHRHAFESFGGVPHEIVLDNLKAAVLKADLDDTILSTPYRKMAQHYGCLIHPCRPYAPKHKGKVENGVHYVQRNCWAGERFTDLADANRRGYQWVKEVAGVRDHGTTHEAPLLRFHRAERSALLPLPDEPFALEAVRSSKVHTDCHVTVEGSFYSVPHGYIGRVLEVHLFERTLQLYDGLTLLVTYPRAKARGERVTRPEHYPPEKRRYLERTPDVCRQEAGRIGPSCRALVEGLLSERPLDQLRAVQSLLRLSETVGPGRLEAACARALHFGDPRYRRVKMILKAGLEAEPLEECFSAPPDRQRPASRSYTFARSVQEFFPAEVFEALETFETEAGPC